MSWRNLSRLTGREKREGKETANIVKHYLDQVKDATDAGDGDDAK